METEFHTLWVDDNHPFVQAMETELKSWLDAKGFELKLQWYRDATDVIQQLKCKDVELIIIDYKLPKKQGDVLINEIRQADCYQDVIFYSEGGTPNIQFDGVFYVRREDVKTRIKELIELKLKRLSNPVSVRGWIVADTIELDGMITDLLLQCFTPREGVTFSQRLLGYKSPLELFAKYKLLCGIVKDMIDFLDAKEPKQRSEQLTACKKVLDKFNPEVIDIRNTFAHQKVEDLQIGRIIRKSSNDEQIVLNDATFVQIRKDLRKHRDNLVILKNHL